MKFILSYMKKYKWFIGLTLLVKFGGTFSELLLPYVLEHIIDEVAPSKNLKAVLLYGLLMILIAIFVRVMNVTANRMSVRTARRSIYAMRKDLFEKSINLSGENLDEIGLPSLISRMTSDSYNIQSFMQSSQTLGVRAPILLLGGIIVTLFMDKGLALILILMAPLLLLLIVTISFKGIPLYTKVQAKLDGVVRIMRENITGIRVIKALGKEGYEKSRFEKANEGMSKDDIKASIVMSLPMPLLTFTMNIGLTLVVLIGARRVNNGVTRPGVILAFLTYFQMILMGIMGLNRIFMMMSKANASAERIASVIHGPDTLLQMKEEDCPSCPTEDFIVFDHVSFSYGKTESLSKDSFAGDQRKKTLEDVSFSIKKGGSLGIIGATGSGKTTILNLLMRFYDADEGHIFVDGKDVRSYSLDSLRQKFGVVFQNDVIFQDTIRGNVAFGRKVDEEALGRATGDALAKKFIDRYEDGLDHQTAIRGANFSGGQKQRLLISRAFVGNPEILVLDDSSSALDYKTDAELRKNIRTHHQNATTIVVAQRISSIRNLDCILMVEEGKILGIGKHEELLKTTPSYREIFETQMGEV